VAVHQIRELFARVLILKALSQGHFIDLQISRQLANPCPEVLHDVKVEARVIPLHLLIALRHLLMLPDPHHIGILDELGTFLGEARR
jgi:hypothetical protein